MKAIWNGVVIAESDETVVVENNHYSPMDSMKQDHFASSTTTTHCPWKGDASYLNVIANGNTNADAAWFYPEPKEAAQQIAGHVAFWRGVVVSD